jgi:proline racemase
MAFKRLIHAVETHSGEPMRVITGGVPHIPGETVHDQMKWLEENDDQIRKLMLREPRGYPPLCCNLVVPAKHPEAAAGYIIMEQVEYPVMSGGNTIAVATVLLETGMIPMVARGAGRADRHPCGVLQRQGHPGDLRERARVRGVHRCGHQGARAR